MANIKKNKNTGKYYFVIEAGKYLDSGKRRQIKRSGFRTKKEAKESMVKIVSKLEQEKYVKQTPIKATFASYIEHWFEAKRISLRPSTIVNYRQQIDYNILPYLGHFKIADITEEVCRRLSIGYIMSAILPEKLSEQLSA